MLRFSKGNAKLDTTIATFSLPAGHTCPFANECFSKADRITGRITDGKHCKFRCFAASDEARMPTVRRSRWGNFEALKEAKTVKRMAELIHESLPKAIEFIRVHVSGDFFNRDYFRAWWKVAEMNPAKVFYAYTKAAKYVVAEPPLANLRLTVSKGGKGDGLIAKHNLISAEVVFTEAGAIAKGLEIDHDDHLAIAANQSFALLLHGTQPKGTQASEAWKVIKRTVGGYNVKKRMDRGVQLLESKK